MRIGAFRRTFPELEASVIIPLLEILPRWSYKYNESKHVMKFPNGSYIKFGHVQYDKDVFRYQGEEFDAIGIDELTLFNEFQFKFLKSRLRTTKTYVKPCFFATTNPGNIGHAFVKRLWIERDHDVSEAKESWEYIPALVYDNPILIKNDPSYVARLEWLPEDQKKAMLFGDWDAFAGQYFKEWRKDIHVVKPFKIPNEWRRIIALDYWYTNPSAVLWIAIDQDDNAYVYREIYTTKKTYSELCEMIRDSMNDDEDIFALIADPALQAKSPDTGVSFFDIAKKYKFDIIPGVNDRVPWWNVLRGYLKISDDGNLGWTAKLKIFSVCANLIRTLPTLIYDKVKVEDLDTDWEDHAPDALRYGLVFLSKKTIWLMAVKQLNEVKKEENARRVKSSKTPLIATRF